MKEKIKNILYYIFASLWYLLSLLPFRVLYFISDILYYPLYYCVRYRRKVVRKNLLNSFPEKDLSEIIKIEKGFYSFFCDYIVETIKLFSMTEKNMRKRMTFSGIEELEKVMGNDKNCILYLGHYCNWEWISSLPLHLKSNLFCGQIYHPLQNKIFDTLFLKIRSRFNANNISMKSTLRKIVNLQSEHKQFIIGFISDQTPVWESIHYWISFLNQDTPVFIGPERITKQSNSLAYYAEIKRIKR